ncbi:C25 family cysteine peptidase [Pontibacter vulgaris]|uniref:putative type IX secretion system sortase PorU2 n=1 Tax=Pontibacter vulgaris TaxID=2905679 RepID=UPI001FA7202A|nr:C25 family cysteine peptidase [Pontibacter vulgaris]
MPNYTSIKQFLLILALTLTSVLFCNNVQAQQTYGNEWIKYDQTYYKIRVTQTGLHQLDYTYLSQLGLAGVNPKHFQLFRRGKEVSIYVAGEQDEKLDTQDYIEFFGERNDGQLDKELYKNPAHQINPYYSLYTDTAAYFLTVSPGGGKRMQVSNPTVDGRTPEPYHLQKATILPVEAFYGGKAYSGSLMPWMDQGEGFVGSTSRYEKTYTINQITNIETTGPRPQLRYIAYARNEVLHNFVIRITDAAGVTREIARHQIVDSGHLLRDYTLDFSDIKSPGTLTLKTLPDLSYNPDGSEIITNQVSVAYASVTFPQKSIVTGNNMFFFTDSTRTLNPYFSFTGAGAGTVAYDITDQGNIIRTEGVATGTTKGYVIAAGDRRTHKLLLANTASPIKPQIAKQIVFRNIDPAAHNFIILTNKRLMAAAEGSALPAPKEYAAYRASAAGGSYDTLVVFVDDIVNQFHYGEFTSNAIRRFVSYMRTSPREKHLLILGKGVEFDKVNYRNAATRALDLVPTFGVPGSDIMFSADFRNNSYEPKVPTGRLSVTSPQQIINYLNKVKEYEALPEGLAWRKNILQLGGGVKASEMNQFATWLRTYKEIAEGPLLGANVIEKYRQNVSEVVETMNVSNEVNAGVSLMTFFGHSSLGTTDLDIGFASSPLNGYQNKGKYPLMLMNGCNIGSFASSASSVSLGEDWIAAADKGAIGLIAHSHVGLDYYLHLYSLNFYTTAFKNPATYGLTVGNVMKETVKQITSTYKQSEVVAMVTEMGLQGDPAVKPYTPGKPDYMFQDNVASVKDQNGELLTATSESFVLNVGVDNLGKAITDSVTVTVKRTLSDNTEMPTDSFKIGPIIRKRVLQLPMNNKGVPALGLNTFEVTLDSPNEFDELNEGNNILRFQYYFPANGLISLTPKEYSIVNTEKVKLVVQATDLQRNSKGFYFEIDTTQNFNSSLKQTHTTANALLPEWEVNLPVTGQNDSTVYYWRARFQSYEAKEDTIWALSSFRYIPNSHNGWSQSHYSQFNKASTDKISNTAKNSLKWEFGPFAAEVTLKTVGGALRYTNPPYGIFFNGKMLFEAACSNPGASAIPRIFMIVVDDKTMKMVENLGVGVACSAYPYLYEFGDLTQPASRDKMEAFLKAIPEGYHVAAMSVNNVPFDLFSPTLKDAFKGIGAGLIDNVNLKTGYPYGIVGQKGAAPGSAKEMTAPVDAEKPTYEAISLNILLKSKQQAGTITSSLIGPALSWGTLYHNIERNQGGQDKYKLSVIGINKEGKQEVLVDSVTSKAFDLSNINVAQFPELQFKAFVSDSTARTAPQLKEWFVYYEAPPEGVIRPDLVKVSEQQLSEQANKGSITVPMAFQNITNIAFSDSLTVEVTVTGDGIQPLVSRFKIEPLKGNKTANFEFKMQTVALSGSYKVSMYVNPRVLPEQQYFNNIFEVPFNVKAKLHPVLDVAFDGVHILDGELVSPSPLISITVKDENRHVFLQDPSGMTVVLVPANGPEREISLTDNPQEVRFYPADEKNDFRLEYKPTSLETGKYTLEVRARDVAGRLSGISPYRIGFEVDRQAKISNFYPFPNPFSTKTQFIFTLTGSTIPEHLKIQILTVTGKVVKEIMKEELGPLRIGNNKTEYAWDGTDTYGDKLANGVYLYRVIMSKGEEEVRHKNTFGDKAFKNGYGKLYILR